MSASALRKLSPYLRLAVVALGIALLTDAKIGEIKFAGLKITLGGEVSVHKYVLAVVSGICLLLLIFDMGFRYIQARKSFLGDERDDRSSQAAYKSGLPGHEKETGFGIMRFESVMHKSSLVLFYLLPFVAGFGCLVWFCLDQWGGAYVA